MKCLVSARDFDEVHQIIQGRADIIDLKNPEEGSLGAGDPHLILETCHLVKGTAEIEISAAIGDVPHLPGTVSLAAIGTAMLGVDYVKIGLYGSKTISDATHLMTYIVNSIANVGLQSKIVCAGYADAKRVGTVNPMEIPEITQVAGADVAMLDTAIKDGKRLFHFLSYEKLQEFTNCAHDYGLQVALAGNLNLTDISVLRQIGPDIIGVRSAVCERGDRRKGRVTKTLVEQFVRTVRNSNPTIEQFTL
ncbi:MAG: (5-formylfuran-3-yl)methyl phosphate synthase [Candidatus Heimdallarchaeota archaeon]